MPSPAVSRARSLFSEGVSEVRSYLRERRHHRPAPVGEGLVLDVGSGQAPDPRADVVVDKYLVDSFERSAGQAFDVTRPIVVADAQALPFSDLAFDYVITSHVLEHAPDPELMAAEFQRVARAGFVQVPSRDSELVFEWPFHPWLIDLEGDTLVFTPKPDIEIPGGPAAHAAYGESLLTRLGWQAHRSRWHHSLHWTGSFGVRVEGEPIAHNQASVDLPATFEMLSELGAAGRLTPLSAVVRERLRCPVCRGTLRTLDATLACDGCGRAYPVAGGVPVLLEEAAVSPASVA